MNCKTVTENTWLYLEKSLSSEQAREFDEHLASCSNCQTKIGAFKQFEYAIAQTKQAKPNPFIATQIMSRVELELEVKDKTRAFMPAWFLRPALVSLGILFGITIGFFGAYHKAKQTVNITVQDREIQSIKSELFISDLLDEDKSLTPTR